MSDTVRQPRRAFRDPDDRLLGGVAAGLAEHLGVDVLTVRVAFVLLALLSGFGAVVYAALWVLLPVRTADLNEAAPGMAAATRRGFRTGSRRTRRRDIGVAVSLAVCALGIIVLLQNLGLGVSPRIFWPLLVASGGLVLLWWQTDEASRNDWLSTSSGWKAWLRILVGLGLLVVAVTLALLQSGATHAVWTAIAALLLGIVGVGLVIGPRLLRTNRALNMERAERIRTQERADVAAHLHDSVLQTLALIQRQAGNPAAVTQLARTQERELRIWLFETPQAAVRTLKSGLQQAVAEVEDAHGVPIELVMVRDIDADEQVAAMLAAAREAMVNAAKHSGAARVDVFGEVGPDAVEVFVRDRGVGFVVDEVPADRMGIRGSVVDRMHRHGGTAEIRSSAELGTEVRLRLPRPATNEEGP